MNVTPEKMRRMLAEDYTRRAKRQDEETIRLFEFAIEEGWLAGIAAGIEVAQENGDERTIRRLRAVVAAIPRPQQSPAPGAPTTEPGPQGFKVNVAKCAELRAADRCAGVACPECPAWSTSPAPGASPDDTTEGT